MSARSRRAGAIDHSLLGTEARRMRSIQESICSCVESGGNLEDSPMTLAKSIVVPIECVVLVRGHYGALILGAIVLGSARCATLLLRPSRCPDLGQRDSCVRSSAKGTCLYGWEFFLAIRSYGFPWVTLLRICALVWTASTHKYLRIRPQVLVANLVLDYYLPRFKKCKPGRLP